MYNSKLAYTSISDANAAPLLHRIIAVVGVGVHMGRSPRDAEANVQEGRSFAEEGGTNQQAAKSHTKRLVCLGDSRPGSGPGRCTVNNLSSQ